MKKFKHKITGIIAEENNHFMCYTIKHDRLGHSMIDREIIENSNDWEEVKEEGINVKKIMIELDKKHVPHLMKEESNYLITAFREINVEGNIFSLQKDGRYNNSVNNGGMKLESMLNGFASVEDATLEIYSVKNKYGIEYVLGDTINYNVNKVIGSPFKIDNFFINRDGILLARSSKESSATCDDINTVYKVKHPIYTTTDGVEIFKGDRVWLSLLNKDLSIHKNDLVLIRNFSQQDKEVSDRYLTFTSEENRDKYIKENSKKPVFVSADNREYFEADLSFDYSLFSVLPKANWQENRYRLNDIVKWPKKEWLHFHTKEARQEYIDNNKPKYSLQDIRKAFDCDTETKADFMRIILESLKKLGK